MKQIVAFVHSSHANRIVRALETAGLYQLATSRVHGVVHPGEPIVRADLADEGGAEVRLEAYCDEDRLEMAVRLIREHGHIGDFPSGAVFVLPVEQAWDIGKPTL